MNVLVNNIDLKKSYGYGYGYVYGEKSRPMLEWAKVFFWEIDRQVDGQ